MLCVFISDTNTQCNMHDYIGSHPQNIWGNLITLFLHCLVHCTLISKVYLSCDSCQERPASAVSRSDIVGRARVREYNNWTWLIIIDLTDTNRAWTTLVHCLFSRRSLYLQHIFSKINTISIGLCLTSDTAVDSLTNAGLNILPQFSLWISFHNACWSRWREG